MTFRRFRAGSTGSSLGGLTRGAAFVCKEPGILPVSVVCACGSWPYIQFVSLQRSPPGQGMPLKSVVVDQTMAPCEGIPPELKACRDVWRDSRTMSLFHVWSRSKERVVWSQGCCHEVLGVRSCLPVTDLRSRDYEYCCEFTDRPHKQISASVTFTPTR